ncbi:MAG: cell division ATP-binding protein FtsE [Flavobacteriales bacterium]|jgi:cell division transport system ATP-binding protein|tara:strand:- start:3179 stop:3862 length:684 start_codon:yes stop_codon:yes gene_type:complete
MNKPIILLEGVNLYQDERLLFDNINLSINKGDFIYLVGETGSGKSSLVKSLYAEIKISAGNIFVANYDLNKIDRNEIPKLRRDLGIVFQDFQLLSDRTVNENLKFVLKATGWTKKEEISKRINDVLASVHLENYNNKMPHELSGGEKQRAAIARSLLNNPKVILADEPTGSLDPKKSEKIIELLKEINEKGTTVVIATHDYEIIKKFNARIIKCSEKKLQEISIDEL